MVLRGIALNINVLIATVVDRFKKKHKTKKRFFLAPSPTQQPTAVELKSFLFRIMKCNKKTCVVIISSIHFCLLNAGAICFIVFSNNYDCVNTGTLYASGAEKGSTKINGYYVKEFFFKDNNHNDHCVVIRPTKYFSLKEANREMEKVKFNTTRTI